MNKQTNKQFFRWELITHTQTLFLVKNLIEKFVHRFCTNTTQVFILYLSVQNCVDYFSKCVNFTIFQFHGWSRPIITIFNFIADLNQLLQFFIFMHGWSRALVTGWFYNFSFSCMADLEQLLQVQSIWKLHWRRSFLLLFYLQLFYLYNHGYYWLWCSRGRRGRLLSFFYVKTSLEKEQLDALVK